MNGHQTHHAGQEGVQQPSQAAAPWQRRKRRCGVCQWRKQPDDPQEMGRCRRTLSLDSMAISPGILGLAPFRPPIREALFTSEYFYCCQFMAASGATPPQEARP